MATTKSKFRSKSVTAGIKVKKTIRKLKSSKKVTRKLICGKLDSKKFEL